MIQLIPNKLIKVLLVVGALSAGGTVFAQQAENNALLRLLIKKGIVTQQEADEIQKEAAAEAAAPQPVAQPAAGAVVQTVEPTPAPAPGAPVQVPVVGVESKGGLAVKVGPTTFTPVGFLDLTGVYRSTTVGSGIGTSFGSIPYSNTSGSTIGPLSETRFSAQNSRVGLRVDSNVEDTKVLGYVEADFLGNAANNVATTSNSDTLRMRCYFVDAQKGPWELLAGQDWSMLTPGRKGIGAMPNDVFYTMNMDTNYQVGLVWSRQPQIRVVYHPSDSVSMGLSLENPDQYVGSAATLPTTNFNANQVDVSAGANSSGTTNSNVLPDTIGKVAIDDKLGDLPYHLEASGIARDFRVNTFSSGTINASRSDASFAGSVNGTLGITPTVTLIGTSIAGDGIGRYLSTGLGPDFVVSPADSSGAYGVSPERAYAGIGGVEWKAAPSSTVFGYYGITDFSRNYFQSGSSYLGYGYPGSSNSQNKLIEEFTLGEVETLWKDPAYGALQLITQLSYEDREPFVVASGAPSKAHAGMVFFDVRYVLP
jgi:hypothetical protein